MTGDEHYCEAESALWIADEAAGGTDRERYYLAIAQVHATLALVSATAHAAERQGEYSRDVYGGA